MGPASLWGVSDMPLHGTKATDISILHNLQRAARVRHLGSARLAFVAAISVR
jgi:hypothetical protein